MRFANGRETANGVRAEQTRKARELGQQVVARARNARKEVVLLLPLFVAVVIAYDYRVALFGVDEPVRIASVVALLAFGLALARALGRALGPALLERVGPGAAGGVGFLVRLATIVVAGAIALRVAGIDPQTLVAGSAVTALILGLAGQQTLGNVVAGAVILATGHMKIGDPVRVQRSTIGPVEGVVSSIGLLYTQINQDLETIVIPNNLLITAAIVPLKQTQAVELRARLTHEVKPSEIQDQIQSEVSTPTGQGPEINLEEIDADQITIFIRATPVRARDRQKLSEEILSAVSGITAGDQPTPTLQ
jgi:small conductance mechanosensitive channel